eukprot:Tbor_TRINITY_DN5923_c1_g1::TRINITY_DN5923_c1_g1_i6::g.19331::m.19331/K07151/STT3; dolichyl-diphosphooligosaccharide--protein glycosyltransferase
MMSKKTGDSKKKSSNGGVTESTKTAKKPCTTRKVLGVIPIPSIILHIIGFLLSGYVVTFIAMKEAFDIRTIALKEYGYIIHEFDPWFNYRATQYLAKHGWSKFFSWFDYMSWYPLGRPVGTTIYPGLQIISVLIHKVLKYIGKPYAMTLNRVCCTFPCWGGAFSTLIVSLITYEATSGSYSASAISAIVMAIVPSHTMRSIGGGYDNESMAMGAMCLTFYFWIRSLRNQSSWPFGILAGLSYGIMAAAWGGFIFVTNLIALHAASCAIVDFSRNRFSDNLYRSFTLYFVIGVSIATCIPVVGFSPFKSLEQISSLFVFIVLQILKYSEYQRLRENVDVLSWKSVRIRVKNVMYFGAVLAVICAILAPMGYFGPISSRVRSLFLKHTRTGNPLVDSVAEHQPANSDAIWQYFHYSCYGWAVGTAIFALLSLLSRHSSAAQFILIYSLVVHYFCTRMSRLILLAAPVACVGTGASLGFLMEWILHQYYYSEEDQAALTKSTENKIQQKVVRNEENNEKKKMRIPHCKSSQKPSFSGQVNDAIRIARNMYRKVLPCRQIAGIVITIVMCYYLPELWKDFSTHSKKMAGHFSDPQLIIKVEQTPNSPPFMVDDYRESYFWLRDKTPEDSRVMAWWDYGYQITGIGNRTSIADGNTWNHEHIATLGKCLTSPVKEAHSYIRHLADYVYIWAGQRADDLQKSHHMARIGNSVYRNICPNDPLCSHFGFYNNDLEKPTPMMKKSLLYNMHGAGIMPNVNIDGKLFQHVFTSKYGLVRIFKVMNVSEESKAWVADPANRKCDYPGSMHCPGQYPPAKAIQKLLKTRLDFAQLEDFNRKKKDDKYVDEYMKGLRKSEP